jgi:hypothetical protein
LLDSILSQSARRLRPNDTRRLSDALAGVSIDQPGPHRH